MVRLGRLQDAIRSASDPGSVMQRIVEQAIEVISAADGAAVELVIDGALTYVCAGGRLAPFVGTRLSTEHSLSGLAVETGTALSCGDTRHDPRVDAAACQRLGTVSMICVPLRRAEHRVGVLKVSSARAHAFSTGDVATLGRLAHYITTVLTTTFALSEAAEALFTGDGASDAPVVDMEALSEFVANVSHPGILDRVGTRDDVDRMIATGAFTTVFQPVFDLHTGQRVGCEALTRFPGQPARTPQQWFSLAQAVGRSIDLQTVTLESAVRRAAAFPADRFLALNVDADALAAGLVDKLARDVAAPLVVELTEHCEIDDYLELRGQLAQLRESGKRLAIDDTGAGYSSFSHIVKLAPDFIKLDMDIVRGIDFDPVRRSLVTAVVAFARDTGAEVVAEGIETPAEHDTLVDLGVRLGQGFHLSPPVPADELLVQYGEEDRRPA